MEKRLYQVWDEAKEKVIVAANDHPLIAILSFMAVVGAISALMVLNGC